MESRTLTINDSTLKYGNINIRSCGKDFFPSDVFGGPSRTTGIGNPIFLKVEGLAQIVKTDIPKDQKGRPRWIFRKRKWVSTFVEVNKLQNGDEITILRNGKRSYFICLGRKPQETKPDKLISRRKCSDLKSSKDNTPLTIDHFRNKLFEGDCLEIMPYIPSNSVDMILCDLPYGATQNHWDSVIPLDRLWLQYERIIKDRGAIVLTSQGLFTAKVILSNEKLFRYKVAWIKSKPTNFLNAKKQPLRRHEDICVFYKKHPTYNPEMSNGKPYNKGIRKNQFTGSYGEFNPVEVKSTGSRYPTDVVYFKTAENEGQVWHPTQKPVQLGRYLIRTFTKPGEIVLDNAFGSGSFLVAAFLEGRDFIGIERNKSVQLFKRKKIDYISLAKERLRTSKIHLEQQKGLFNDNLRCKKNYNKERNINNHRILF